MAKTVEFEVTARLRAPLPQVWAWWTDFGTPGPAFPVDHGLGRSMRTVLEAEPGRVLFEDRAAMQAAMRREVRIFPDHRLEEEARGSQRFRSTWTFASDGPDATRIVRAMALRTRFPPAAVRPIARLVSQRDLAYHARECERALSRR